MFEGNARVELKNPKPRRLTSDNCCLRTRGFFFFSYLVVPVCLSQISDQLVRDVEAPSRDHRQLLLFLEQLDVFRSDVTVLRKLVRQQWNHAV